MKKDDVQFWATMLVPLLGFSAVIYAQTEVLSVKMDTQTSAVIQNTSKISHIDATVARVTSFTAINKHSIDTVKESVSKLDNRVVRMEGRVLDLERTVK